MKTVKQMMKLSVRLILSLALVCLFGCYPHNPPKTYKFYVTVPQDPEGIKQAKIAPALIAQLRAEGAQVVQVGETIRIILLSDQIFNGTSANLQPQALWRFPMKTGCCSSVIRARRQGVLDTVAGLMLVLQTTSAQVSGYTNASYSCRVNQALSLEQAVAIQNYLWDKGVDARLIYAVGYGDGHSLSPLPADPINRRIEIDFQFIRCGLGRRF
ncbi:MAG: OmpA family protein [Gammaproteobacteria bacterium]